MFTSTHPSPWPPGLPAQNYCPLLPGALRQPFPNMGT